MRDLTFRDAVEILRLVDAEPRLDFEVRFEDVRIKVRRRQPGILPPAEDADPLPPVRDAAPSKASVRAPAGVRDAAEVKPPMAGVFYRAPAPGAQPFVEVDRAVQKGEQVGVVEVMKLFTAVLAPCDGVVRAILAENGRFVESGETLMIIEPETPR